MTFNSPTFTSALCLALAACPAPTEETHGGPDAAASTSSTTDTGADPTTADPTTGDPDDSYARVVYFTAVRHEGSREPAVMRWIEIVDGVAAPPITLVDPPGKRLISQDAWVRGRWSPVYSAPEDPAQLWLVDLQAMTPHEVPLPAEVERVDQVRLSSDGTHLIVRVGPTDIYSPLEDMTYYVCPLGPQGECALERVEPATGPTTYISWLADISGASGRIWYETQALDLSASYILQGDVAAPEAAAVLASFAGDPGWIERISLDGSTLYFTNPARSTMGAIDIGVDPPGAPVEVFPPLTGTGHLTWADDESALLVWNGDGPGGDLHQIALDGASAGPLQTIGSPGHVRRNFDTFTWSADRASILFLSDHEAPDVWQLYAVDSAAPGGPPTRINPPLPKDATLKTLALAGADHVLYALSDPWGGDGYFRARLDTPGVAERVTGDGVQPIGQPVVSADGTRAVHLGEMTPGHSDLFLLDLGGEAPDAAMNLTFWLPLELEVSHFRALGTDAADAVFSVQDGDDFRLYMAPLSPVGAPVRISEDGEAEHSFFVVQP